VTRRRGPPCDGARHPAISAHRRPRALADRHASLHGRRGRSASPGASSDHASAAPPSATIDACCGRAVRFLRTAGIGGLRFPQPAALC
jgi:hypothetical protein